MLAITLLTLVILFGMRLIFWFMFNNPASACRTSRLVGLELAASRALPAINWPEVQNPH